MARDSSHDDALTRAIAARDAFFEAAAHDLRSPLTALMLQLDTVLLQLQQPPPDNAPTSAIEQRVRAARRQVDHLARLTERLTDVVRIDAGGDAFRLDREPLELRALASSSVERCEPQLRWAGCALSLSGGGEPLHVSADRTRLEEVLGNLLGNASKYAAGAAVDVAVTSQGDRALVCVADRGPGIPPHMKERIFDKFERGTGSAPGNGNGNGVAGLGLGLWISRAIVEAHGGSLSVDDTPGGGATFVMALPKQEAP